VEADGALSGHLQACILEHAERCGVGHVRVQDAACFGHEPVYGEVDVESRVLDPPAAGHHLAAEVQLHQVARLDFGPQQAERREQEAVGVPGNEHRQVIVDPFIEAEAGGKAMAGRQIDARLSPGIAARPGRIG